MKSMEHDAIFKCQNDRPSYIFKELLHKRHLNQYRRVGVDGILGCGYKCAAVSQEKDKYKGNKIGARSSITFSLHTMSPINVNVTENVYVGEGEREMTTNPTMMVDDYH